jgi:hypothetical protein
MVRTKGGKEDEEDAGRQVSGVKVWERGRVDPREGEEPKKRKMATAFVLV